MSDAFLEIFKSAPPLVVLVVVVWFFLNHLAVRDKLFAAVIQQVNTEHIAARLDAQKIIEANSTVISRSNEQRGEITELLREMQRAVGCCTKNQNL
ncbi:MAG: hypothetical protein WCS42_08715 [Verrucomicrobiota bacterium]